MTLDGSGSQSFGGLIQDGGSGKTLALTVGAGTQTLSASNTFSGALTINGGVVATDNLSTSTRAAQGVGVSGKITLNGGTLRYTATTFGSNSGGFADSITVGANGGTLDITGGKAFFLGGPLSGSGPLTFLTSATNGSQWLIINNNAAFSGNITIGNGSGSSAAGTSWAGSGYVQWRSNAASPLGSGTVTINTGGVFTADNNSSLGNPSGTLANNFILNGGRLGTQNPSIAYGGTITLTANSFIGSPQTASAAGTLKFSNVISGASFGLTKDTIDTATFTAANTYGGGTTINQVRFGQLELHC